jgi:hypothetical protein
MEKFDILQLFRVKNTVFTFKEILLASGEKNPALLKRKIYYYTKKRILYRIRRGVYAKDRHYDRFEAATKIFIPSYISFETILGMAGVTFQHYDEIFLASYQTRELLCDHQKYFFRKIKDDILFNDTGLENNGLYTIASPERAFLDVLYLQKDYHFDNLSTLDVKKIQGILPIYGNNRRMQKKVKEFFHTH